MFVVVLDVVSAVVACPLEGGRGQIFEETFPFLAVVRKHLDQRRSASLTALKYLEDEKYLQELIHSKSVLLGQK